MTPGSNLPGNYTVLYPSTWVTTLCFSSWGCDQAKLTLTVYWVFHTATEAPSKAHCRFIYRLAPL